MKSIYKISNGMYVDLDRIVAIEAPRWDNPRYSAEFYILMQLMDKPVIAWFNADLEGNTGEKVIYRANWEFNRLCVAWEKRKKRWRIFK